MYMKRWGNGGTYLQVIQSLRYVCFTYSTLVTNTKITSAYMASQGLMERPQVS